MMGMQATPERLFYDFCLDDHVPADHLLRRIDRSLDLASVRQELKPFYSMIGRPSIDPELMTRMLIVGYCFAIRSELSAGHRTSASVRSRHPSHRRRRLNQQNRRKIALCAFGWSHLNMHG